MAVSARTKGVITGVVFSLLFGGLGVWTLVDPSHATDIGHSETGRSKARAFKAVMGWMFDTIGAMPTGILLVLIGLVILGLTIRAAMSGPKPAPETP